jgi:putative tryptophan/tyrosine transport system substrate-binding protein
MRRREFIAALGGTVSFPFAAPAQQPTMPIIGFLNSSTSAAYDTSITAFRGGLVASGYVEGRNVAIEYRMAEDRLDRLATLANDLVGRRVAVIATASSAPAALAAKAATQTIPIVFVMGSDPVKLG